MKTPDQMAQNYLAGMQNPQTQTKYKQGISNYQGNPMALAASDQAMQRYITNVTASVTSGKRAAKLNAVPVERWRQNSLTVGASALSTGAQKAKDKVLQHFQKWAPIYAQASAAAHALPKGGFANAVARASAAIQVLMQAAGRA